MREEADADGMFLRKRKMGEKRDMRNISLRGGKWQLCFYSLTHGSEISEPKANSPLGAG